MSEDCREPTGEECDNNAVIFETDNQIGYALWYPQMSGYVGKAVVEIWKDDNEEDACFDVLVWHDGDWPFNDGQSPRRLHHCSTSQFINFGMEVDVLQRLTQRKRKGD